MPLLDSSFKRHKVPSRINSSRFSSSHKYEVFKVFFQNVFIVSVTVTPTGQAGGSTHVNTGRSFYCLFQEEIQNLLKTFQLSTRQLHHMCGHSKVPPPQFLTREETSPGVTRVVTSGFISDPPGYEPDQSRASLEEELGVVCVPGEGHVDPAQLSGGLLDGNPEEPNPAGRASLPVSPLKRNLFPLKGKYLLQGEEIFSQQEGQEEEEEDEEESEPSRQQQEESEDEQQVIIKSHFYHIIRLNWQIKTFFF